MLDGNQDRRQSSIRRARCLVSFWESSEFIVENYLSGKQTTISPLIAHCIEALEDYLPWPAAIEHFRTLPGAEDLVNELVEQDVLVVRDSPLDTKEKLIEAEWEWKLDARYFHYSTQHVLFEDNLDAENRNLARLARDVPPPPPFKDYGRSDVKLTCSVDEYSGDFWEALRKRRTRRLFAREAIPLQLLSTVLMWTWGRTHLITDPEVGEYVLKTSPSGGARHPTEVYPLILRVEGVEPGIYHYSVKRHELERLRPGFFEELGVQLCANQEWVKDAAAVFFMTSVLGRSMWKYKQSHAYRVILLDAGHLGQTFHLVCTKLGLAPFTTAATRDSGIEEALELDGVSEIPIYTAAMGWPRKSS